MKSLVLLALASLTGSLAFSQTPPIRNLGVEGLPFSFAFSDERAVFLRTDTAEQTLQLLDLDTLERRDLGRYSPTHALTAEAVLFLASEAVEGVDLNGDGDRTDVVLHVYDIASRELWNSRIAMIGRFEVEGSAAAFLADEDGFQDWNEDGDTADRVVFLLDTARPALVNTRLAARSQRDLALEEGALYLRVDEDTQGSADLNGDGDADDAVLHVFRPAAQRAENTGLAVTDLQGGSFVTFKVSEAGQGDTDLNGDGDALDRVLHVLDPVPGSIRNTGLAAPFFSGLFLPELRQSLTDGVLGFSVSEREQGQDLDGNGDLDGFVFVQVDAATGFVWNSMLAHVFPGPVAVTRDGYVLAVDEAQAGIDLDGDGVPDDEVLHFVRRRSTASRNLLVSDAYPLSGGASAYAVGPYDPSGECGGQSLDLVDVETGAVRPLDDRVVLYPGLAHLVAGARLVHYLCEADEGADLNGDGDRADEVLHVADPVLARVFNTGLTIPDDVFYGFPVRYRSSVFLNVDEGEQGEDLNGDGDLDDRLLHRIDVSGLASAERASPARGNQR